MKVKHAMILAAGLGTRMKPLTLDKPKPLIKVGNKNLLERSINLLESYGIKQIIINSTTLETNFGSLTTQKVHLETNCWS